MANSAALAALLGGNDQQSGYSGGDPVGSLQNCIQDLHQLMAVMPDAKHTQMINQALAPLLAIQAELSQAKQQPRQQVLQQLGG